MSLKKIILLNILFSISFNYFVSQKLYSQNTIFNPSSIIIAAGGIYQMHLEGGRNDDPNIPNQFEYIEEIPSINTFFKNNGTAKFLIEYKHHSKTRNSFSFGFEYDSIDLKNKSEEFDIYFGNTLNIKSLTPYVKYYRSFTKTNLYLKLGVPIKIYQGKANLESYSIKNNYDNSLALRLGCGLDSNIMNNIQFCIGADCDFGTAKRKNVEFYTSNQLEAALEATGDDLQDTQISAYFLVAYVINLNKVP